MAKKINRFSTRQFYAQPQMLNMGDFMAPKQFEAQQQARKDMILQQAAAMNLPVDARIGDTEHLQNLTNNYYTKQREVLDSISNASNPKEASQVYADFIAKRNKLLESGEGRTLAQRKAMEQAHLAAMKEKLTDPEEFNFYAQQYSKNFPEYNPADPQASLAINSRDFYNSYNPQTDFENLDKALDNIKDRDVAKVFREQGIGVAFQKLIEHGEVEGVTYDRMLNAIQPVLNNPDRINQLVQRWDVMEDRLKGTQYTSLQRNDKGQLVNVTRTINNASDFIDSMNQSLIRGGLGSKVGTSSNTSLTKIGDSYGQGMAEIANTLGFGDNASIDNIQSQAFEEGNVSYNGLINKKENISTEIANLQNRLSTENLDESKRGEIQGQIDNLQRQQNFITQFENNLNPEYRKLIASKPTEELNKLKEVLSKTKTNMDIEAIFGIKSIEEAYGKQRKVDIPSTDVYDAHGEVLDDLLENYPELANKILEWKKNTDIARKKIDKDLKSNFENLSRTIFTAKQNIPGMNPAQSKYFWSNTVPNYFGDLGTIMGLPLVNNIEGHSSLESYLNDKGFEIGSDEYESIQKSLKTAAKNTMLSTHPSMTDKGVWSLTIPIETSNGTESIDLMFDTDIVKVSGQEYITNSPSWQFDSAMSTAASYGLDKIEDSKFGKGWEWKFNSRNQATGVLVNGKEYSVQKMKDMYVDAINNGYTVEELMAELNK